MKYDYLKIKSYDERIEDIGLEKYHILSFTDNHHIKVSEKAKKIIDLFNGKNTLSQIEEKLKNQGINVEKKELENFVSDILISKALIEGTEYNNKSKNKMLWLKIPLIDSIKLSSLFNVLKHLFNKKIMIIAFGIFILNVIVSLLISLDSGLLFKNVSSFKILVIMYMTLLIHEFGHASAAKRCGIDAGKIGVGFYFISPVMYVDITSAWRVDNKKRVLIDIGGVYFQAISTIFISILALITGDKTYYLCNVSVLILILFNLMPFLKLDGYWLFCDYFKISNVSANAFKVIKSKMKQLIKYEKSSSVGNDRQPKVYYIFSFIYGFSILSAIIIGCVYSVTILQNREYILEAFRIIATDFTNSNFAGAFTNMNNIFIYLLPIVFISVMVVKIFINVVKGVVEGGRTKKCKQGI